MRMVLKWLVGMSVFLAVMASLALLGQQVQPSISHNEAVVLRLAAPYPEEHPTALAAAEFAALVQKESAKLMAIELLYENELGSKAELLEQLQFGGVALAVIDAATLGTQMPQLSRLLTIPEGSSPQEAQLLLESRRAEINGLLQQEQITMLAVYTPDYRCIATVTQPIRTPIDCEGLRLAGCGTLALKHGAQRVEVDLADLPQSIANAFVDGGEMSLLEYTAADYPTIMPYLTVQPQEYSVDFVMASDASMGFLSAENQKMLDELASETAQMQHVALLKAQKKALKRLRQTQVKVVPDSLLQATIEQWPQQLLEFPWLTGGEPDA